MTGINDVSMLSAEQLTARFRRGSLSPVEVATRVLEKVDALNPELNAFCFVDHDGAIDQARESEARWLRGIPLGPLDGVPASVKDLWSVAGWPTRKGSATTGTEPACEDAPAVSRMREGGAVLVGKTTTCEFGWKGVTDSRLHGSTRNPWDRSKTSGGSSGGAAAAAAAGLGVMHLGSDGAGSIRIPAAFCGVFGFKPTWGRVAAHPYGPLPMLSHSGPIVRTVDDAYSMLGVIARPDLRDWLSLPPSEILIPGTDTRLNGLKIAYSPDLGYVENISPDVAGVCEAAIHLFEDLGATVELYGAVFPNPRRDFELTFATGLAATIDALDDQRRDLIDPGLLKMAEAGRLSSGIEILKAWARRAALGSAMNEFHQRFDLLVTPQMPLTAFTAGVDVPDEARMSCWLDWSPYTYPFNLTGQPAAALPCGVAGSGLPVSLQIVGPRYGDAVVLRACRSFERARPFPMPGLPLATLTDRTVCDEKRKAGSLGLGLASLTEECRP